MLHSLTSGRSDRQLRSRDVPQQHSDSEEGADVNQKREDPVAVYLGGNSIDVHRSRRLLLRDRPATILRSLSLLLGKKTKDQSKSIAVPGGFSSRHPCVRAQPPAGTVRPTAYRSVRHTGV